MNAQDAQLFCKRWLPLWTGNQPEALAQMYAEDAFYRDPAMAQGLRGRTAMLAYFRRLLAANPTWVWRVGDIYPIEGGFVLRWQAEIPVGQTTIYETGMDLVLVNDDLIVRNEVYFDRTAILAALRR